MEQKKTDKANVDNRKATYGFLGLVAALAGVLILISWTSFDVNEIDNSTVELDLMEEEIIPQNMVAPPPPPPPPPAPTTVIEIVEDDEEIEEELEIEDFEVDDDTEVEIIEDFGEEEVEEDEIFFVGFVVNKEGKVEDVQILRGVHADLDKEAKRVVQTIPKFTPGKQRGKPVKVTFFLPITFNIQD